MLITRREMLHYAMSSLALSVVAGFSLLAEEKSYDPLRMPPEVKILYEDATIVDSARNREIPIRIFYREAQSHCPVILFSHGLGGSLDGNHYLNTQWVSRGFVVVLMQHHGSDREVLTKGNLGLPIARLKAAANVEQLRNRIEDVKKVLDALAKRKAETTGSAAATMDLSKVGLSGHSFGAMTTQAVSGQKFESPSGRIEVRDSRIGAALMMSPSAKNPRQAASSFGAISMPWLLMTGTEDHGLVVETTPENRRLVYHHLPPGDKYELVLDAAKHMAFSDRTILGAKEARNPQHHQTILAISTAFWEAYLKGDQEAKKWLQSDNARAVMAPEDVWQYK